MWQAKRARQGIFDASEDAVVGEANNAWEHGLTSKSIEYDKAKLRVKVPCSGSFRAARASNLSWRLLEFVEPE